MPANINAGGTWQKISKIWANAGGTWQQIQKGWINAGGTWELFYSGSGLQPPASIYAYPLTGNEVEITWDQAIGDNGYTLTYDLYRNTTASSPSSGSTPLVSGISYTSYVDTTVTTGTAYYYWVRSVETNGTTTNKSVWVGPAYATVVSESSLSFSSITFSNYTSIGYTASWTYTNPTSTNFSYVAFDNASSYTTPSNPLGSFTANANSSGVAASITVSSLPTTWSSDTLYLQSSDGSSTQTGQAINPNPTGYAAYVDCTGTSGNYFGTYGTPPNPPPTGHTYTVGTVPTTGLTSNQIIGYLGVPAACSGFPTPTPTTTSTSSPTPTPTPTSTPAPCPPSTGGPYTATRATDATCVDLGLTYVCTSSSGLIQYCLSATPTPTPTPTSTSTSTSTPTPTSTSTSTSTPSPTLPACPGQATNPTSYTCADLGLPYLGNYTQYNIPYTWQCCGSATPAPTSTSTSTSTPAPTSTSTSTSTPAPTSTPQGSCSGCACICVSGHCTTNGC